MIVTLTTDFGARDYYVAAVKGTVLGLAPGTVIVDVSHAVAPGDVEEAAFVLSESGVVGAHLGQVYEKQGKKDLALTTYAVAAKAERPESIAPAERSPVVEDLKGDWNGPMPSFLSLSAV